MHGSDERGRMIRRTLARYLILLEALTFQAVSTAVKKRFPTEDHLVEAGLMTKEEKLFYDDVPGTHSKWWVPNSWFTSLIVRTRKEGRIKDDKFIAQILDALHDYRTGCGLLFAYDWISIPLVYTQTVTIATYTYFLASVVGRQYLDPVKGYSNHDIDLYVPVFTLLEFFFFMGWLKVAEQLINPFGEDDDDFELNWILDRNLLVGVYVTDELCNKCPKIVKDMYWDDIEPALPYTKSSAMLRNQPHLGSAMNLNIDPDDTEFVPMTTIMEEETEENSYDSPPQSPAADSIVPNFLELPKDDNASQVNRFFPDFSSAPNRILNMIMGQSTENLSKGSKDKLDQRSDNKATLANTPFLLKSPTKKRRNNNSVTTLQSAAASNQVSRANSIILSESVKSQSELSTLPIPIPTRRSSPAPFQTRPSSPSERNSLMDFDGLETQSLNQLRPDAALDEATRVFGSSASPPQILRRPLFRRAESLSRPRSRNSAVFVNMPEGDNISTMTADPSGPPTPEIQTDATNNVTYEPSSSQESLSPYESNQSTVTSFTQLLRKNKD